MSDKPNIIEGEIIDFSSGHAVEVSRAARESTTIARACDVQYTPFVARVPISIREATLDDIKFIDSLQKNHTKEVGFLQWKAIEGKIKLRQVLIAEVAGEVASGELRVASEDLRVGVRGSEFGVRENQNSNTEDRTPNAESMLTTHNSLLTTPKRVGYIIAQDRYFKRDEVGCIVQINVLPEYRRSLVATELLQAQFARSAYGCRLYCCWCAQDLKANEFWESMGFTAIAFRTGSMTKGKDARGKKAPRVHIFWQTRIRAGDVTTPWWYPSQTGGGEIRDDRVVLPIMPGVSWRDVGPILLGESEVASCELRVASEDPEIGVRGSEFGVRGDQASEEIRNPSAERAAREDVEAGEDCRATGEIDGACVASVWAAAACEGSEGKEGESAQGEGGDRSTIDLDGS